MISLKKLTVCLAASTLIAGLSMSRPAMAQQSSNSSTMTKAEGGAQAPTQRELDWKAAKAERRAIFGENMLLSKTQSQGFWPLYDQYEAQMDKIEQRHVREVRDFSKNATKLTDDQATQKLNEVMAIAQDRLNVQKAFIPKFRAVLGPIQTTRFYQIDNKLRALLQAQIAQMVPLATPPNKLTQN